MKVLGLYAGKATLLADSEKMSAIKKQSIETGMLQKLGLEGDEQADLVNHGGPRQALHQFSETAYHCLQEGFPDIAESMISGTIGENITISEMSDSNVYLNDIYQIGASVQVRVTRPRRPCWKVDSCFGLKGITKFLFQRPITGWYYEVLTEGQIRVGDDVELLSREDNALSVGESWMTKAFEK